MTDYEFKPGQAEADAVTRADKADNPKMPKRSFGDRKTSPVSEAEVTEHGTPSVNNGSTSPVPADKTDDVDEPADDDNA